MYKSVIVWYMYRLYNFSCKSGCAGDDCHYLMSDKIIFRIQIVAGLFSGF